MPYGGQSIATSNDIHTSSINDSKWGLTTYAPLTWTAQANQSAISYWRTGSNLNGRVASIPKMGRKQRPYSLQTRLVWRRVLVSANLRRVKILSPKNEGDTKRVPILSPKIAIGIHPITKQTLYGVRTVIGYKAVKPKRTILGEKTVLQTKYVRMRIPISVYKKVPIPKRNGKPKRDKRIASGRNLKPNSLQFKKSQVSFMNANDGSLTQTKTWYYWNNQTNKYEPQTSTSVTTGRRLHSYVRVPQGDQVQSSSSTAEGDNYSSHLNGTISELSNVAITALYKKVKNQDVNVGAALAEYKSTVQMFSAAILRLAKTLVLMKKLKLRQAAATIFPTDSKKLANDWLLLQYGIKPLLSDLDGMAKYLATPESKEFDIIVRRTRNVGNSLISKHTQQCCVTEVWSEATVEVVYKVRVEASAVMRDVTRLGLGNLLAVGWEVIPFSFVADWFIPIGEYINTADAFSGLTVLHSHKTVAVKETRTLVRTFGGFSSQTGLTTQSKIVGFVNKIVSVNREINIPIPPPILPELKNPFSAGHLANAIALLRQLKK